MVFNVIPLLACRQLDVNSYIAYEKGAVEVGSEMKGSGFYLAKRENDGMTSSFVAVRTNLIPSYSRTCAGGIESTVSEPVSLSDHLPRTSSSV